MFFKRMTAFIMLVIVLATVPYTALAETVDTAGIVTDVAADAATDIMDGGATGDITDVMQGEATDVTGDEQQIGGDVVAEPEIVEITEDIAFDNIIPKERFQETDGTINTEMAAVIINMTEDFVIGSKNALEEYNSIDFAELMTLYTALKLCKDTTKVVTVTQQMLTPVKNSLYLSGFQVNDQITYKDLILCYMFTSKQVRHDFF